MVEAIQHARLSIDALKPEVRATIRLMKNLEAEFGVDHVRLVFWFDT
jgi:hypothetical protein